MGFVVIGETMCGIMGYVGSREAVPFLLEGLKGLEYRGYDSAGVAIASKGALFIRKRQGKLAVLEESLRQEELRGSVGIGHTRWATHGVPNEINAHPHLDCRGEIAIVHNGILENYAAIRQRLLKAGHTLRSQTDSELLAHLIESVYRGDLEKALRQALKAVIGTYAVAVLHKRHPGEIVGARKGSPLVLGIGRGEQFLASDILAFLSHTRQALYLEDGETAVLKTDAVRLFDRTGKSARRAPIAVEWDASLVQKGGFPHYMLKEIHEQPEVLKRTLSGRTEEGEVIFEALGLSRETLRRTRRVMLFACGTAWHAALVGKYYLETVARIPCDVDVSSEFRYRNPPLGRGCLAIPVSQSGETADTLAGLREARARGAKVLSICNVVGSSIARESDAVLYTHAGPEIAVPSTKAYTSQLAVLFLLALYLGRLRRVLQAKEARRMVRALRGIPAKATMLLSRKTLHEAARGCGQRHHTSSNFLYLGRGVNYPTALEGALKLKELSYIHAEGVGAGEMKHGPIALIGEGLPVVCVAPQSATREKMLSSIQEVRARHGTILSVATEGDTILPLLSHQIFYVPAVEELLSPLLTVIPLQMLAYHLSVESGCDVDQPRNLAKSVTVE